MGELETVVREIMAAYDKLDGDTIVGLSSEEIQVVDEQSRAWLRGIAAMKEYFSSAPNSLSDIRTKLSDFNETVWGDTGLVTFWLEQDYKVAGAAQHVSAPTSCVLRNEGGNWRAVLFHSIPLADA